MKRRPQPSKQRGLLRALAVVIALTALFLLILFAISSLAAPPATAPTVPATPYVPTSAPAVTPRVPRSAPVVTPQVRPTASRAKGRQSLAPRWPTELSSRILTRTHLRPGRDAVTLVDPLLTKEYTSRAA